MKLSVVCALLLATAGLCCPGVVTRAGEAPKLRVATFRCDVTPPLGSPAYPCHEKPLETIETPLFAKGIVLDDGQRRCVLCAVDWCGLCGSTHRLFCSKVAAGAGTDVSNVAVHTVHQHTAPYIGIGALEVRDKSGNPPRGVDPQFLVQLADRLGETVKNSLARLEPFDSVGTGQAEVDRVASTRRVPTGDGKVRTRWSADRVPIVHTEEKTGAVRGRGCLRRPGTRLHLHGEGVFRGRL